MFTRRQIALANQIVRRCRAMHLRLATAESCTGGLIAACLTSIPGSSAVIDRGFITYDDAAKTEMLGVSKAVLRAKGAVSEEVARAMAVGTLLNAPVDVAIAVTGIAGPGGGTENKPVGLVHVAAARIGYETLHESQVFAGTRKAVRISAAELALSVLGKQLS
jgi:nicotinamide-nucleotide amidase